MNDISSILLNKPFLDCVAYYYCKENNINRYSIPKPSNEVINSLIDLEVISKEKNLINDTELGYACYEFYRQGLYSDCFDQLIVKESKDQKVILDLCCGPGATIRSLLNFFPESIYAIDTNPRYIKLVKGMFSRFDNSGTRVIPILGDAHNIPLDSNSVDYVVCRVSLQYLEVDTVLKEIYRVLRKGGKAFITVHGTGYLINFFITRKKLMSKDLFQLIIGLFRGEKSASRSKFLFQKQLFNKMQKAGFTENQLITNKGFNELGTLPVYFSILGRKEN
jgi:ubiquinone/menaquinone biosynthesis C-methylase UbiE